MDLDTRQFGLDWIKIICWIWLHEFPYCNWFGLVCKSIGISTEGKDWSKCSSKLKAGSIKWTEVPGKMMCQWSANWRTSCEVNSAKSNLELYTNEQMWPSIQAAGLTMIGTVLLPNVELQGEVYEKTEAPPWHWPPLRGVKSQRDYIVLLVSCTRWLARWPNTQPHHGRPCKMATCSTAGSSFTLYRGSFRTWRTTSLLAVTMAVL